MRLLLALVAVGLAVLAGVGPAAAATPPLRLLAAEATTPLVASDGRAALWVEGGTRLRHADARGRIRTLPLPEGCRLTGGPHRGEALLVCGAEGEPLVLDLATGATRPVARPRPRTWPGAPDVWTSLGRTWIGGSVLCDSRSARSCPVYLHRTTGERRQLSLDDRRSRDVDDPGLRRLPPPGVPSCRTSGRGGALLRGGDAAPLVLVRCGPPRDVVVSRCRWSCGSTGPVVGGVATWTEDGLVGAVRVSTGRLVRWRVRDAQGVAVVGRFVYVSAGTEAGHGRLLRARRP